MLKSYLLPHPPLLLEDIGNANDVLKIKKAYTAVADEINRAEYDVVIIISPHNECYEDAFYVDNEKEYFGNMQKFHSQVKVRCDVDVPLANLIVSLATNGASPINATTKVFDRPLCDHGTIIPLTYVHPKKVVTISQSGLSLIDHYRFGKIVREACERLNRKAIFIASGDLSHCCKPNDGEHDYHPAGPRFNRLIRKYIKTGNTEKLLNLPKKIIGEAKECGLKSIITLLGFNDGYKIKGKNLAFEDPYGVGYLVASFKPVKPISSQFALITKRYFQRVVDRRKRDDMYVDLARKNVESYVLKNQPYTQVERYPEPLLEKAACFVSIKKNGSLRGCIGSVVPETNFIADEIIRNSFLAATHDPRFPRVELPELDQLTYSVDILSPLVKVDKLNELNPKKYGILVCTRNKQGVLLPDIGINDVAQQLNIAKDKAKINRHEPVEIFKFTVDRHQSAE
ncbi:MAG: AmmeMemoRadiSam system protein A [Mycoplasmataceae bacterium]|jgi:AmmeMemoRadiSam system protein A|nr:AmmeMemoRadiSam system protein A [Mycoplasmataceae bacterium]